jgi:hypothetical protein
MIGNGCRRTLTYRTTRPIMERENMGLMAARTKEIKGKAVSMEKEKVRAAREKVMATGLTRRYTSMMKVTVKNRLLRVREKEREREKAKGGTSAQMMTRRYMKKRCRKDYTQYTMRGDNGTGKLN